MYRCYSSVILRRAMKPPPGIHTRDFKWSSRTHPCILTQSAGLKPLSQWEVSSGDIELTRCNSTVKAICVGLASSANYPDQWSDATITRRKLHCERVELFVSLLGGAAYAAVSRDFRSVLHLRFYQRVLWLSIEHAFKFKGLYFDFVYISSELFLFPDLRQRRAGQIAYALVVPPRD